MNSAGSSLTTTQNGTAVLFQSSISSNKSFTFGSTSQELRFGSSSAQGTLGMEPDQELYYRNVMAVNGTVKSDMERLNGKQTSSVQERVDVNALQVADFAVRDFGQNQINFSP